MFALCGCRAAASRVGLARPSVLPRLTRCRNVSALPDAQTIFSVENTTTVFTAFNSLFLIPWFAMIFLPNAEFTKTFIKSNVPLLVFSALYCFLFIGAAQQSIAEGRDVGSEVLFLFTEAVADPVKMAQMSARPSYAAQDWAHLCTWDYFVGSWIYLRGLERGVFTSHSLFLTFNSGPFGLLMHFLTESITLKLRGEAPDQDLQAKIAETRRIAADQDAKLQSTGEER